MSDMGKVDLLFNLKMEDKETTVLTESQTEETKEEVETKSIDEEAVDADKVEETVSQDESTKDDTTKVVRKKKETLMTRIVSDSPNPPVVGDLVEVRGPIGGYFVWDRTMGGPLLLVAGGSGVVPLMAMLRHNAASDSSVPAVPARLLYSSRFMLSHFFSSSESFALSFLSFGFFSRASMAFSIFSSSFKSGASNSSPGMVNFSATSIPFHFSSPVILRPSKTDLNRSR